MEDYRFEEKPSNNYYGVQYTYIDDNMEELRFKLREIRHLVYMEDDQLTEVYDDLKKQMEEIKAEKDSCEDEDRYEELDNEYWDLYHKMDLIEDEQEYLAKLSEVL